MKRMAPLGSTSQAVTDSRSKHDGPMLVILGQLPSATGVNGVYKCANFFLPCFLARGPVHTKFWDSVKVKDWKMTSLTSDVRFPNNPKSQGYIDNFDSPYALGDNYGIQLITYFVAPESGFYTFEAACDDICQIFLSNSSLAKDKEKIIDVRGWTSLYQYDK